MVYDAIMFGRHSIFRRSVRRVWVGLLAALPLCAALAAQDPVQELLSEVERLDTLRETLQRERAEWEIQKESMTHGMDLLQREKALLEQRIAAWTETADVQDEEALRLEQRRAEHARALQEAGRRLDDVHASLQSARCLFPDLFEAEGATAPADRLRTLFGAATGLQRQLQSVVFEQQLMDLPDGSRRQMDVLKLGHSQAYAVALDNTTAAHGVWSGERWEWRWDPAWAREIRHAIRVYQGEGAPRWVLLPVSMPEGDRP